MVLFNCVIGKINPILYKDDIYVCELSMTKLYEFNTKPLKYKEASKYPSIKKDVAFIVDNNITNKTIEDAIKKAGGRFDTEGTGFEKKIDRAGKIGYNTKAVNVRLLRRPV